MSRFDLIRSLRAYLKLDGSRPMEGDLDLGTHKIKNSTIYSAARAYLSAVQSIPSGAWTKISLDTESFDYNDEFNTSAHEFIVKSAATYFITGFFHFHSSQVVASKLCGVMVKVKGASIGETLIQTAIASYAAGSFATIVEVGYLDYIDLWVYHNFGVAKNVSAGSQYTHLALCRLV